jgi:hypothetical protein
LNSFPHDGEEVKVAGEFIPRRSSPQIPFVIFDAVPIKKSKEFFLKCPAAVVLPLGFHILYNF